MGYTHYWKQTRWIEIAEWRRILNDIARILEFATENLGIKIGDGVGKDGSMPIVRNDTILFNGILNHGGESFCVERLTRDLPYPDWEWTKFCKTGMRAYDPVVVACLCHLSTATRVVGPDGIGMIGTEAFHVTSDGRGKDFLEGLDLARRALPELGERLDLPLGVMAKDRWTSPWVRLRCKKDYEVRFCIDGHGYVLDKTNDESARFESHAELAAFLADHARVVFRKGHPNGSYGKIEDNIWEASGMFDTHREARIEKAQRKVLSSLFPSSNTGRPPLFVRPDDVRIDRRQVGLFDLLPDRLRPDHRALN